MPRARPAAILLTFILLVALWAPVLRPAGQGAILIADLYAPALVGANVGAWVTPRPREAETRETFAGAAMRVSWWRPGWGERHPAVMLVNGATPLGNDNAATRSLASGLARAGFLVMLAEFPFLKEGRLDADAPRVLDAAFAHLRDRPETRGRAVGAFGASVGGGVLLCAAGSPGAALANAAYLAVLGAYFDIDTYFASVASHEQPVPETAGSDAAGRLTTWTPSAEAQERIPTAAVEAAPEAEREAVRRAFARRGYADALAQIRALPARTRAVYDALSPERYWSAIRPPVYWIHDPNDDFEPLAEALAAEAAPRDGRFTLLVPGLVKHAEPGAAKGGALETVRELGSLLGFAIEIVRLAN